MLQNILGKIVAGCRNSATCDHCSILAAIFPVTPRYYLCKVLHLFYYVVVKFGSCNVEKSASGENSAGLPTYKGRTQITSSCVATDNCQNSVHVISTYEGRSDNSLFSIRTGSVSLRLSVTGEDTKPLILVLTSYYPIRWNLIIPPGVVFDKLIVVSDSLKNIRVM